MGLPSKIIYEELDPLVVDPKELPDNYRVALALLISTEKRLLKNPDTASLYRQQMDEMIEKNFARNISDQELKKGRCTKYVNMRW